jgi:hypothetical protein
LRFIALSLVSGLIFAAAVLLEAGEAQSAVTSRLHAEERGVGILVISNNGADFKGTGCATLGTLPGVVAWGKLFDVNATHLTAMPNVHFQVATVSPHLVRLLDDTYTHDGVGVYALGGDFASVMSASVSTTLTLVGSPSGRVGGILRENLHSQRHARWAFRIAIHSDDAPIRECWIKVAPNAVDRLTTLAPAFFRDASEIKISRLASADSLNTAIQRYETRSSRFAWIAAGCLMAVLSALNVVLRKNEYALYSLSGFRPDELGLLSYIEFAISIASAAVWGTSTATFVFALAYPPSADALTAGAATAIAALSLSSAIGLLASGITRFLDISKAVKNRD